MGSLDNGIEADEDCDNAAEPHPWFMAKCRSGSGNKSELPVLDLSAGGCLVETAFRPFKVGERVTVQLPGLSPVPGAVVWLEERTAGIAFEAILHGAVFDHLLTHKAS